MIMSVKQGLLFAGNVARIVYFGLSNRDLLPSALDGGDKIMHKFSVVLVSAPVWLPLVWMTDQGTCTLDFSFSCSNLQ